MYIYFGRWRVLFIYVVYFLVFVGGGICLVLNEKLIVFKVRKYLWVFILDKIWYWSIYFIIYNIIYFWMLLCLKNFVLIWVFCGKGLVVLECSGLYFF